MRKRKPKPGRPTKAETEERRREVLRRVLEDAAGTRATLNRIAKKLKCGWLAVRNALEARLEDLDKPEKTKAVAQAGELVEAYLSAKSAEELLAADRELLAQVLTGKLDRLVAETVLAISRECRMKLEAATEERARIDSRKPLVMQLVWTSDWREKAAANRKDDEA
jgi:hypothetical protein